MGAPLGDILTDMINWLGMLPPLWAYLVILAIAYGENVIPPVPGDMVIVFGGVLAGRGELSYPVVDFLSTVGGVAGFMTVYALGHYLGQRINAAGDHWLPSGQMEKTRQWMQRWGYGIVLANRFLSGARSAISLSVGMAHMDPWKTAGYATLSAVVWTALIAYAGYEVGENWPLVSEYLKEYGRLIVAALLLFALIQGGRYYLMRRTRRRKAASSSHPEEFLDRK